MIKIKESNSQLQETRPSYYTMYIYVLYQGALLFKPRRYIYNSLVSHPKNKQTVSFFLMSLNIPLSLLRPKEQHNILRYSYCGGLIITRYIYHYACTTCLQYNIHIYDLIKSIQTQYVQSGPTRFIVSMCQARENTWSTTLYICTYILYSR